MNSPSRLFTNGIFVSYFWLPPHWIITSSVHDVRSQTRSVRIGLRAEMELRNLERTRPRRLRQSHHDGPRLVARFTTIRIVVQYNIYIANRWRLHILFVEQTFRKSEITLRNPSRIKFENFHFHSLNRPSVNQKSHFQNLSEIKFENSHFDSLNRDYVNSRFHSIVNSA